MHIENKMENYVKNEWGFSVYLSGLTSNQRGVMVLINNNFDQEVTNVIRDTNGNFIILEIIVQKQKITLANIYGPNEDKPQFYNNLKQKIDELGNDNVIICGDWNLVIDPNVDTENYKSINNPNARSVVVSFLDELEYMDAWRLLNEDKKGFTWRRLQPENQRTNGPVNAHLSLLHIPINMFE